MEVRFNPIFGWFILACGSFGFLTGLMFGEILLLLKGLIVMLLGFLNLTKPTFVIAGREIEIKNLAGMTTKRYHFQNYSDILVEGSEIFINQDGSRTKVKVPGKAMLNQRDWNEMVIAIQKRKSSEK